MYKLKQYRVKRDLTQKQLGDKAGVSQPYINELERKKKVNPSITVLRKLAKALDITISELLEEDA